MDNFSRQKSLTKSELKRRRERELEEAWGGLSLDQAISSSPYNKRGVPSNLNSDPIANDRNRLRANGEAVPLTNGSDIARQMDSINDPVRLAENLYNNYDLINEQNALEDEYEEYMNELEEAKGSAYEEEKNDENYWNSLYENFNQRHTNTNPPHPRSGVSSDHDITPPIRSNPIRSNHIVPSQDNRPIQMNPNGEYDLNFIDWNNEWEAAHEAMDNAESDEEHIPGIPTRDIQALYDAMMENEDFGEGLKKDILKTLKIIKIKFKKEAKKYDTCSICL
jgi:hypothetical protein